MGVERSWEGAGKVSALTDSTLSVVTYASLTLAQITGRCFSIDSLGTQRIALALCPSRPVAQTML